MNGAWIDKVHDRRPPKMIIPRHGLKRQPDPWRTRGNRLQRSLRVFLLPSHYSCSTSSAIWSGAPCVPAMSTVPTVGVRFWNRSLSVIGERNLRRYFRGDAAFAAPDIYEFLESEGFLYAIRLPKNQILQESIAHLLTRPRRSSAEPCAAPITPASGIRLEVGTGSGAWWPRWNGTRRVVPPRRLYCHQPVAARRTGGGVLQSPWDSGAVHQGRQIRHQVDPGCHAASSATTGFGSSFTPWLTIWATSCGRLHCRRRWNTGR